MLLAATGQESAQRCGPEACDSVQAPCHTSALEILGVLSSVTRAPRVHEVMGLPQKHSRCCRTCGPLLVTWNSPTSCLEPATKRTLCLPITAWLPPLIPQKHAWLSPEKTL